MDVARAARDEVDRRNPIWLDSEPGMAQYRRGFVAGAQWRDLQAILIANQEIASREAPLKEQAAAREATLKAHFELREKLLRDQISALVYQKQEDAQTFRERMATLQSRTPSKAVDIARDELIALATDLISQASIEIDSDGHSSVAAPERVAQEVVALLAHTIQWQYPSRLPASSNT